MSTAAARPHSAIGSPIAPVLARPALRILGVDAWLVAIVAVNLAHIAVYSRLYPEHQLDPDLIAYFTYFRNWLHGDPTLQSLAYYTAPKTLLVFTLGMLGSTSAALACTAVASAVLGAVVYAVARDAFGRPVALATSVFLLADPSKAFLTLKSSADLYLALLLFLAIWLAGRERWIGAALTLFFSVLIKPVTLPCAAYVLAVDGERRRRWIAALIPFGALPLVFLANHALLGSAVGGAHFFAEFASMAEMQRLGPAELVHYAIWSQLVKIRFVATASWGMLGIVLWLRSDRARLTAPLLLMPLLFLFGYLALATAMPFPPYFRYFWPLEIWFLMFLVFGAFEGARRLAHGDRWLHGAIVAIVLLLLTDGMVGRQLDYRGTYAVPIERSLRFAEAARRLLPPNDLGGTAIVTPLSLLPSMTWHFPAAARTGGLDTAERLTRERLVAHPDWILDIPAMYKTASTRRWIEDLARSGGYEIVASDGQSALLRRRITQSTNP